MKTANVKRIFSGIQPSGRLHIGNYIGALSQWTTMQNEGEAIFCVVDMHAITVPQDPKELKQSILSTAALYLAAGVDPKKSIIFVQSHNRDHAQLAWILDCHLPMGWLNRMTQFKDKSGNQKESASTGLYTYPALMAADILLYRTNEVPVGEDQVQHVELARDLAKKMNQRYGEDLFTIPQAKIRKSGARIMSLSKPERKMSKSDADTAGTIFLLDDADAIMKKIKRAVTDSKTDIAHSVSRPGLANLLSIYSAVSGKTIPTIEKEYAGKGYKEFKEGLGEEIIAFLSPLQKRYRDITTSSADLERILKDGKERAEAISHEVLKRVSDAAGLG